MFSRKKDGLMAKIRKEQIDDILKAKRSAGIEGVLKMPTSDPPKADPTRPKATVAKSSTAKRIRSSKVKVSKVFAIDLRNAVKPSIADIIQIQL